MTGRPALKIGRRRHSREHAEFAHEMRLVEVVAFGSHVSPSRQTFLTHETQCSAEPHDPRERLRCQTYVLVEQIKQPARRKPYLVSDGGDASCGEGVGQQEHGTFDLAVGAMRLAQMLQEHSLHQGELGGRRRRFGQTLNQLIGPGRPKIWKHCDLGIDVIEGHRAEMAQPVRLERDSKSRPFAAERGCNRCTVRQAHRRVMQFAAAAAVIQGGPAGLRSASKLITTSARPAGRTSMPVRPGSEIAGQYQND